MAGADGSLSAPVSARYVRVEFTRVPTADERTGLRELEAIRAP